MKDIRKAIDLFKLLVARAEESTNLIEVSAGIDMLANFVIYGRLEPNGELEQIDIAWLNEDHDPEADVHNAGIFYLLLLRNQFGPKVRKPEPLIRFAMKILDLVCEHDRVDISCAVHLLIMQLHLLENGYVEYRDLRGESKEIRSTPKFQTEYQAWVRVQIPWPQYNTAVDAHFPCAETSNRLATDPATLLVTKKRDAETRERVLEWNRRFGRLRDVDFPTYLQEALDRFGTVPPEESN